MDRVLLSNYLLENHTLEVNEKSIIVDGKRYLASGAKSFFDQVVQKNRKTFANYDAEFLVKTEAEIIEELRSLLEPTIAYLYRNQRDELKEKAGANSTISSDFYRENTIPVIDAKCDKGSAIILNKETGRPYIGLSESAWKRKVGKDYASIFEDNPLIGHFFYNPRNLGARELKRTELGEEVFYNLYVPPSHLVARDKEAVLDSRFCDFLENFFTDESRKYAYSWIYRSCFEKMPTYLLLVGAGGIGKNLLAEVMSRLHGMNNFKKAPDSALNKEFNGHLLNCTAVYYDECKFSASGSDSTKRKNKLKDWANNYVAVEKKGKDSETTDIYCSCIISTNNVSDVHLEQLDRKFSPVELNEQRLEKRIGVETTKFLWKYINDESFPHALLNYLESRIDKNFDIHKEHRGTQFEKLVMSSLFSWQHELIFDHILNANTDVITLSELRNSIEMFPRNNEKVKDFINNFHYKNEILAEVYFDKSRSAQCLKINDKFLNVEAQNEL